MRSVEEVLAKTAALIRRIIDYEIFTVMLLDEASGNLYHRFAIGYSKEIVENWRIPLGQGITGTAAATRQAIRVSDVRKDPRYINAQDSRTAQPFNTIVQSVAPVGAQFIAPERVMGQR